MQIFINLELNVAKACDHAAAPFKWNIIKKEEKTPILIPIPMISVAFALSCNAAVSLQVHLTHKRTAFTFGPHPQQNAIPTTKKLYKTKFSIYLTWQVLSTLGRI